MSRNRKEMHQRRKRKSRLELLHAIRYGESDDAEYLGVQYVLHRIIRQLCFLYIFALLLNTLLRKAEHPVAMYLNLIVGSIRLYLYTPQTKFEGVIKESPYGWSVCLSVSL